MMVKWKNEAIEAADAAYHAKMSIEDSFEFWRIVLDAAVKAQGLDDEMRESALQYIATAGQAQENYARGRAEALEEAAAFIEGKGGVIPGVSAFARLLSRNNQPCMSGDARDRLNKFDRRYFDEATSALADAIRALAKQPPRPRDAAQAEARDRLHAANNALTVAQIALRRISSADTTSDLDGLHEGKLAKIADEALAAIAQVVK